LVDADEADAVFGVKASWLLTCPGERQIQHVWAGKYVRFSLADIRGALDTDAI
jgi:hypothetical protein